MRISIVKKQPEIMINDEDLTSTQMMVEDARARRNLKENESRFKCDMCEFKSGSKNLLNRHMKTHQSAKINHSIWTEKEVLASTSQPEITRTRALLLKNKKPVSKRIYCELCEKKFNKQETYSKHMLKIHKRIIELEGDVMKIKSNPPSFYLLTKMTLRSKSEKVLPTNVPSNAEESNIDKE